jgi:pyruvate,orthophosphate dikinase
MQMQAIIAAAITLKRQNIPIYPEVMIPLIGHVAELAKIKAHLTQVAEAMMQEQEVKVPYLFGTMIEIPRAALTADEIAREAEFFSFGTNDLTQMTFGFSRDDAEGKFLNRYLEQGILADNPFEVLDQDGVGKLMETANRLARETRPDIHLGVCGEHGGEPRSIDFCHRIGLDYVSCSPYRVPVARLAAAQAAIRQSADTVAGKLISTL